MQVQNSSPHLVAWKLLPPTAVNQQKADQTTVVTVVVATAAKGWIVEVRRVCYVATMMSQQVAIASLMR